MFEIAASNQNSVGSNLVFRVIFYGDMKLHIRLRSFLMLRNLKQSVTEHRPREPLLDLPVFEEIGLSKRELLAAASGGFAELWMQNPLWTMLP